MTLYVVRERVVIIRVHKIDAPDAFEACEAVRKTWTDAGFNEGVEIESESGHEVLDAVEITA